MTKQRFAEELLLAFLEKYTGESPIICEDGTPMAFVSLDEDGYPYDQTGVINALHVLCTTSPQELESGTWATWDYVAADTTEHNYQVIKEVYVKMIELTQQMLSAKQKPDDGTIDHLSKMQHILGQVSINLFNENLLNKDEDDIPGWNWWYDLIPEKINGVRGPGRPAYPDDQRDEDGIPHWIKEFLLMCERVADRKTMLDDKYREKAVWAVYKGNDAPKKLDVSTIHTIITTAKGLPYMDNFIQHEIKSVCLESNVSEYDITAVRRVLDSCIETGIDGKGDPDHLVQKCDNVLAGIEMGIAMSKKEDSETQ